jgi:CO/xanthine dehydrogenase FAD-binding subunit
MVSAPKTLKEALDFRAQTSCTVVAGGTDQYVRYRNKEGVPPNLGEHVLYLMGIGELSFIRKEVDHLAIGATATLSSILNHDLTPSLLKQAIRQIGGPGIRNMGTLAGNIANASPAADAVSSLVALGASVTLQSLSSERIILVEDFILGVRKTALGSDELITSILVPLKPWNVETFRKVGGRKADAISKVSFCGLAKWNQGKLVDIRIALGAVAVKVVRDAAFETSLLGEKLNRLDAEAVASHYAASIAPIDDQRSTKEYRHEVAENLVRTFIRNLAEGTNAQ